MSKRTVIRSAIMSSTLAITGLGGLAAELATAPSAAAAANVGGVDVVAVAQFSSCEGRVYLEATPLETLDGAYDVYFRADVYDYGSGAWGVE